MSTHYPSLLEELTQSSSALGLNFARSFQPQIQGSDPNNIASQDHGERSTTTATSRTPNSKACAEGQRRGKYTPRACQDCQRRKVKCSGENVCSHCRARNVRCVYAARPEEDGARKRARPSSPANQNHDKNRRMARSGRSAQQSVDAEDDNQKIQDKIALLQERARRFSESTRPSDIPMRSVGRRRRPVYASTALYHLEVSAEDGEETDTFNNGTGCNNLSISAQLSDLHTLLNIRSGRARQAMPSSSQGRIFPLELPDPSTLQYLLDVYFREMGSFFPFLDRPDTEGRICATLQRLGHSDSNLIVDVDSESHSIMALLCNMLVLGDCQDPEVDGCDGSRPGWAMYQRGRRLIQSCGSARTVNLDLIGYHTLSALYMMDCELLMPSCLAISTAVQLAFVAKLNDQALWGECTPAEKTARQRLWWTIYFLDRRITQRNGTPYLIRDTEVAVNEFEHPRAVKKRGSAPPPASRPNAHSDTVTDTDTDSYFQSLIDFSKLWGCIWDTLYAASVPKGGDWKEAALADSRILVFRQQLPSDLAWNTEHIQRYVVDGESDTNIKRRLAIYIRTNLLRMIIRQNPILSCDGDEESREFCGVLARTSIDAIAAFTNTFPKIRSSGYLLSTSLVECIYHLVYILQDRTITVDRQTLLDAFLKAYQLLSDFASAWVTAKRALHALSTTIFSHGDASALFQAISKPQSERANDTPYQEQAEYPDTERYLEDVTRNRSNGASMDMQAATTMAGPSLTELSAQILQQVGQPESGSTRHLFMSGYGEIGSDFDTNFVNFNSMY